MATLDVYDAIQGFLGNKLTDLADVNGRAPPVLYDNPNGAPPSDGAWIDVELAGTSYGIQSLGSDPISTNRYDEEGLLELHVMVPLGSGSREARRIAKGLIEKFRGLLLMSDRLEFRDSHIARGYPSDKGKFFDLPVVIEWRLVEA